MSVRQYIYLGPIVQLKLRSVESETASFGCVDEACSGFRSQGTSPSSPHASLHKFCSICGRAYGIRKIKSARKISVDDVVRDKLTSVGTEDMDGGIAFLAPNTRTTPRAFLFDRADEAHIDVGEIDRDAEMLWMRSRYAVEIDKLKSVFGDVRVSWGLHVYFM
jgi:hypothetical protein